MFYFRQSVLVSTGYPLSISAFKLSVTESTISKLKEHGLPIHPRQAYIMRHCLSKPATRANLPATRAVYPQPALFTRDPRWLDTPQRCWLSWSIVQSLYSPRKLQEISLLNACIKNDDWHYLSNELFSLNTPVKSDNVSGLYWKCDSATNILLVFSVTPFEINQNQNQHR